MNAKEKIYDLLVEDINTSGGGSTSNARLAFPPPKVLEAEYQSFLQLHHSLKDMEDKKIDSIIAHFKSQILTK
jgi:hypothetical protein